MTTTTGWDWGLPTLVVYPDDTLARDALAATPRFRQMTRVEQEQIVLMFTHRAANRAAKIVAAVAGVPQHFVASEATGHAHLQQPVRLADVHAAQAYAQAFDRELDRLVSESMPWPSRARIPLRSGGVAWWLVECWVHDRAWFPPIPQTVEGWEDVALRNGHPFGIDPAEAERATRLATQIEIASHTPTEEDLF